MEHPKPTPETDDAKAIRLLNEQLKELESVRGLNGEDPNFKAWQDTTTSLLKRFLPPTSPHLERFVDIAFISQIYPAPPGHEHGMFVAGCKTAEATIKAVLKYIEEFGVHVEQARPGAGGRGKGRSGTVSHGGVQQNFYGSVEIRNQAIATDNAIQRIGQMGDMGARQSMISPR